MNRKKMSLRAWMYLKITPAALFLVYYWMCTRRNFRPSYLYLQAAVFAAAWALSSSSTAGMSSMSSPKKISGPPTPSA